MIVIRIWEKSLTKAILLFLFHYCFIISTTTIFFKYRPTDVTDSRVCFCDSSNQNKMCKLNMQNILTKYIEFTIYDKHYDPRKKGIYLRRSTIFSTFSRCSKLFDLSYCYKMSPTVEQFNNCANTKGREHKLQ